MKKPIIPTSIKFNREERAFLKRIARAQKHGHISKVVKTYVRREMTTGAA